MRYDKFGACTAREALNSHPLEYPDRMSLNNLSACLPNQLWEMENLDKDSVLS